MGAVHGVYLKYVGLSAISYAGYSYVVASMSPEEVEFSSFAGGLRMLSSSLSSNDSPTRMIPDSKSMLTYTSAAILKYSSFLNGAIACLFKLERGMKLIGKNSQTGQIPLWSYVLYFPFHIPSIIYTKIHARNDKKKKTPVPTASEVQPGWWVGGMYADSLGKEWGGIIDLTVEFPERCINSTKSYHLVASWDGVPASPEKLEEAATFAVQARKKGDVLIHCAHGRGRSTTTMCAALVKAGLFPTWQDAFEKGIKPGRSVCKLNKRMRDTLQMWQDIYVDKKQ